MVTERIFETAVGISTPWFIAGMNFDPGQKKTQYPRRFRGRQPFRCAGAGQRASGA